MKTLSTRLGTFKGKGHIVTYNTRDFERAELHFPKLRVMTRAELIMEE